MSNVPQNTEPDKYVKSIKDVVKRRFAESYLAWIRAGRVGSMPARGALSPARAKILCTNLDALS